VKRPDFWAQASCLPPPGMSEEEHRAYVTRWFYGRKNATLKRVCHGCAVEEACLEDAMAHEALHPFQRLGIRGGKTPAERLAMTLEDPRWMIPSPDPSLLEIAGVIQEATDVADDQISEVS
jgi:hypothetical protein